MGGERLRPATVALVFFVAAPGTLAGWVPWALTSWRLAPAFFGWGGSRAAGLLLIGVGFLVLAECFVRFVAEGRGTPAPPLPTDRLIVSGSYRYLRNPMYLAVVGMILGQALLLGSTTLLWYGLVVGFGFHLFVLGYEEPTLRSRYGSQYEAYCRNVRRWSPRLAAWRSS